MADVTDDLLFSEQHCWVHVEGSGDTVRVGITDHAQQELGDVLYVDLPDTGFSCTVGERCATIEAMKTAADIYAPLNGRILEVNTGLGDKPEQINQSPYERGWLFLMRVDDKNDMRRLMSAAAYAESLES